VRNGLISGEILLTVLTLQGHLGASTFQVVL
jgi:hypothetical protein